jgi:hypothetical protein
LWKVALHRHAPQGETMDRPATIGELARITSVPAKTIGGSMLTALLMGAAGTLYNVTLTPYWSGCGKEPRSRSGDDNARTPLTYSQPCGCSIAKTANDGGIPTIICSSCRHRGHAHAGHPTLWPAPVPLPWARQNTPAELLTAVALNVVRLGEWLTGTPRARTRCSPFAVLQGAFP